VKRFERYSDSVGEYLLGEPELWHGEMHRAVYDKDRLSLRFWVPADADSLALDAIMMAYRVGKSIGVCEGEAKLARHLQGAIDLYEDSRAVLLLMEGEVAA